MVRSVLEESNKFCFVLIRRLRTEPKWPDSLIVSLGGLSGCNLTIPIRRSSDPVAFWKWCLVKSLEVNQREAFVYCTISCPSSCTQLTHERCDLMVEHFEVPFASETVVMGITDEKEKEWNERPP